MNAFTHYLTHVSQGGFPAQDHPPQQRSAGDGFRSRERSHSGLRQQARSDESEETHAASDIRRV